MSEITELKSELGNTKRFYLEGFTLERDCPNCGETCEYDGEKTHMSYPITGINALTFYCTNCGHDWPVAVKLRLTIEVLEEVASDDA